MIGRRGLAARAAAAIGAVAWLATCGCATPPVRAFSSALPAFSPGARFAVVGDTQRTGAIELWRESNDAERALVLAEIARERPAFVAFTGDLVFRGGSADHWADFDAIAAPLHAAALPAVATLGNHEHWGGGHGAHFFARFPDLGGRHQHVARFGPVAVVLVDSNVDELGRAAWAAQRAWLEGELARLDAAPEVRGVLVLTHHPPFTNSTVTGDEAHVARDLVPPFLAARKTLALITGHVHSYERFVRDGKTFVVSGGGGGPRARLATGAARRHPDDVVDAPALRDFGFLLVSVGERGLDVTRRGLAKGDRDFTDADRFALPFPG